MAGLLAVLVSSRDSVCFFYLNCLEQLAKVFRRNSAKLVYFRSCGVYRNRSITLNKENTVGQKELFHNFFVLSEKISC